MRDIGVAAMPIVMFISFLVGVVLALNGAAQAAAVRRRGLHRQLRRHLDDARDDAP